MKRTTVSDNLLIEIQNTSLALGFFDGLHSGHKKVLKNTIELSKKLGTKSVVLTFKNHPVEVLYNVQPEFITTYEERIKLFQQMGIDVVIMAEFTKEIASLTAQEYFEKIILNLQPKSITVGYNHKFGAQQSGDTLFLETKSQTNNFILNVIEPVKIKNEVTSSTIIRNLIKKGDVKQAQILLEKPYKINNIVQQGAQRGRQMNFPTANLAFPEKKIIPKFGVYAGYALIKGKKHKAVANVGLRPTFNDISIPQIEIHILDFKEDIYNQNIEFEFIEKIRDEIKFSNMEKLREQIQKDIVNAKKIIY